MKTADSAAHKGMLQQKCDQILFCLCVGLGYLLVSAIWWWALTRIHARVPHLAACTAANCSSGFWLWAFYNVRVYRCVRVCQRLNKCRWNRNYSGSTSTIASRVVGGSAVSSSPIGMLRRFKSCSSLRFYRGRSGVIWFGGCGYEVLSLITRLTFLSSTVTSDLLWRISYTYKYNSNNFQIIKLTHSAPSLWTTYSQVSAFVLVWFYSSLRHGGLPGVRHKVSSHLILFKTLTHSLYLSRCHF